GAYSWDPPFEEHSSVGGPYQRPPPNTVTFGQHSGKIDGATPALTGHKNGVKVGAAKPRAKPGLTGGGRFMATQTNIYAALAGYVGRPDQTGRVGVFRRAAEGGDWNHVLPDLEAFTVAVHPRSPDIVLAGTADGVWRSTDRGATFV